MSATAWAWLVLLFPLLGSIVIALGYRAIPAKAAGAIGTAAIALSFACGIAALVSLLGDDPEAQPPRLLALGLRQRRRARHQARDLRRPALGLHGPRRHRRLDPDPPLLVRLHAVRRGLSPLLQLPQLLRLLDAAAGPRRQLRPADRRLGLRRLRLLRADQLLVPAHDRDRRRDEGLRDQRRRRHRPGPRRLPDLPRDRQLRLRHGLRAGAGGVQHQRVDGDRDLPAAAARRLRQVGAAAAPHLAAGRDGGPDAGLLADPRGDDGHRRRLPDRPHPRRSSSSPRPPPTSPPSPAWRRCWSPARSPW